MDFSSRTRVVVASALVLGGCADEEAPSWGSAELELAEATVDALELRWSAAEDNREVTGYRIYLNGNVIESVEGTEHTVRLPNLDEATEYRVGVVAVDAAENSSPVIELVTATTDETAPSWP
ncbi:MAG: fibronectin type III domain-containing protein, partial [Myxococcota bacterium]